jgi:hypothetical protein
MRQRTSCDRFRSKKMLRPQVAGDKHTKAFRTNKTWAERPQQRWWQCLSGLAAANHRRPPVKQISNESTQDEQDAVLTRSALFTPLSPPARWTAARQSSQTRWGVFKSNFGSGITLLEHAAQKVSPQFRQWWRRLKRVKPVEHAKQVEDSVNGGGSVLDIVVGPCGQRQPAAQL